MISYKYRTFSLPRLLEIIDAKTAAEMGQAPLGSYLADDAETKAITDCLGAWGWRWVRTDGLIAIFEKEETSYAVLCHHCRRIASTTEEMKKIN